MQPAKLIVVFESAYHRFAGRDVDQMTEHVVESFENLFPAFAVASVFDYSVLV